MKPRESTFFWTSYTDLMTSLFFIMLVLYVMTVAVLKYQQKATQEQLKKITEIQNATSGLDTNYFQYQKEYKRFALRKQIQFRSQSDVIFPNNYSYLRAVGKSIERFVEDSLKTKYRSDKIKYLIVIEGMASKDGYLYNNRLSYERALALKTLWIRQGVRLDPNVCEVVIAGSGVEGAGRFPGADSRNQRILIQIIPKIGRIEEVPFIQ
ncbi:hypothetical protein GCM10028808_39760 [Spirosoma migulaei]